jgi:RND family efflux transporter MFP subunit
MKKVLWILFSVLAITVTACAQSATPAAIPTVSLDSGSQPQIFSSVATASGTIVPVKKTELAFPIAGTVKTVEVVEGDSVKANQPLAMLDASILQARVDQAAADILTAEAQVAYLVRVGTSQENLDSAKADVDRAKAAVEVAKAQLAQATLIAPFDGVIASVNIEMSEYVTPGQVIITMGDFSRFRIETTDLSEKDVSLVQIGQTAKVYIDALNKEFTGKVVDIARISETVGGDVVYKVKIELDEQPDGLRWGMSVDVKIETK